jgi:hypothetical protein
MKYLRFARLISRPFIRSTEKRGRIHFFEECSLHIPLRLEKDILLTWGITWTIQSRYNRDKNKLIPRIEGYSLLGCHKIFKLVRLEAMWFLAFLVTNKKYRNRNDRNRKVKTVKDTGARS